MVSANDYMDKIGRLPNADINTRWGFFYSIEMSVQINNQIVNLQNQNNKIIQQNDEIIRLLKQLNNK